MWFEHGLPWHGNRRKKSLLSVPTQTSSTGPVITRSFDPHRFRRQSRSRRTSKTAPRESARLPTFSQKSHDDVGPLPSAGGFFNGCSGVLAQFQQIVLGIAKIHDPFAN